MALLLFLWSLSVWTFPFVDHPDSIWVNLSLVLPLRRPCPQRHRERDNIRLTRHITNKPLWKDAYCFLLSNYFLISVQSSSVPRPSGIESTLFAHLACWQSVFFFFLTSRQCLPGSCGGSSLSFLSAGPAGEGRAMTLLVTSDTAQPLPVDQMEGKCKWETSGWERGQATDQP